MNLMSERKADHNRGFLQLEVVVVEVPWEAVLVPVSRYPIPEHERASIRTLLNELTSALSATYRVSTEVFIHMAHLQHKDGSAIRFSSEGRNWLPKMGLGVWPDRPAPAIWSRVDFENLTPGERPRTLRNHVFQITRSREAREAARNSMLGWGSVIQIMSIEGGDLLLQKTKQLLLPLITDPSFSCFPFYIPLLERKSVTLHDAGVVESWLCGASVYIRESPEDTGVLIFSREPLSPVLRDIGAELAQNDKSCWKVPV